MRPAAIAAHDANVPSLALPAWFDTAFGHLNAADRAEVEGLWRDEAALRTLALLLDTLRPDVKRFRPCPRCGSTALRWSFMSADTWRGICPGCGGNVGTSEGTPFHRIGKKNWHRLYATLLLEWGPWSPYFAARVARCPDPEQFANYRRRLQPLFDELPVDVPLTSRFRYRLGFSPGQQGFRCPYCGGDDLRYAERKPPDKPIVGCRHCGRTVAMTVARLAKPPSPSNLRCPDCGGRNLTRHSIEADGRRAYRCRNCGRHFIENPKKFQPSGTQPKGEAPADPRCPSCGSNKIGVLGRLEDGRCRYLCVQCGRRFRDKPALVQAEGRHWRPNGAPGTAKSEGGQDDDNTGC